MNKYNDFRDMSVWQKAFGLLIEVYKIIRLFPSEEKYALTEDLQKCYGRTGCAHSFIGKIKKTGLARLGLLCLCLHLCLKY